MSHLGKGGCCKQGYKNQSGWCLKFLLDNPKLSWSEAVDTCESKGASIAYVDTAEKIATLQKLMVSRGWYYMYVAGKVKAVATNGFVTFKPAGNSTETGSDINRHFHVAFLERVTLTSDLTAKDIPKEGKELSVMAEIIKGKVHFKAVPSCWGMKFVCEQIG
ncbi:hypothetical protein ElyMa_001195400 [Elysia marginata]|uniref:C-type lectin domain-containing protein n=1 Tax=Elysia marginata TaxID=1093978 RepID=A0AAV4I845_9GAST|nr:hypothetical protein ElyMa_001195400 [Elysia marginata]